ncbi:glycoside hydrolase family 2 [Aurantiacibacter gangjinensis]|uniref:glycoside hydrolase family 2 n=1 Tax=Aurantiacibacter gangjinensis TaxID=502682 RepID=UPI00069AB44A|nr:glycoside hydrolase family 2 [Aurantiacibacter gangjinensis]APE26880.1 Beta-glucuronidase [Aurantiacibacter gangjinensis]
MIGPQNNSFRSARDLSGFWRVAFEKEGTRPDWEKGIAESEAFHVAVPGSWNEQLAEAGYMNFCGAGWYQTDVFLPEPAKGNELVLRFGSADYYAEAWLDGVSVGRSSAPMLPFECAIPKELANGRTARLVVRVDAQLRSDEATQGITSATYAEEGRPKDEYLPAVRFDFFPYGGLNRPVLLLQRPAGGITGWRAVSDLAGVTLSVDAGCAGHIRATLSDGITSTEREAKLDAGKAEMRLDPASPRLWSPEDPHLYRLSLELLSPDGTVLDMCEQRIGLRSFKVEGTTLFFNGAPIVLKGFGKHEESPLHGRAVNMPQLVKDFHLLKWIGANSVRTSHYPYSEEFLDLADEFGILVIDEVFSINLDFRLVDEAVLANHKRAVGELISRDANRTCVIAWSLANEPGYLAEREYRQSSEPYWQNLFAHARTLDPTRPMCHANVGYAGNDDPAFAHSDFLGINRYHGWYTIPGRLDAAVDALDKDFDAIAAQGKPIVVLEFGADAMAGQHASYDQLFTEEYQQDFISAYWKAIENHPSVAGGHVWNFADFRTAQHGRRVVHNLKGVFTRTREPKMAAWMLRRLWSTAE